jgi:hypothetical protein
LDGSEIKGFVNCSGGTFRNPGGIALAANNLQVASYVSLSTGFVAEGEVRLAGSQIGGNVNCKAAKMTKFSARRATIKGDLLWSEIPDSGETDLDLTDLSVAGIRDDRKSWPARGHLKLGGLVYNRISPADHFLRLEWLDRQEGFTPQPYRQLAKVLVEKGDENGAMNVLFEMEHVRRREHDATLPARAWSCLLRYTIGYGHFPGRALWWLCVLTLIGGALFGLGYLGGGIVPVEKEAYSYFEQRGEPPDYYPHFNAFVYSLEHAIPLVPLGQKDHWRPNPSIAGTEPKLSPGFLRMATETKAGNHYLLPRIRAIGFLQLWPWFQIVLGWVLATLFVVGLTGIVRKPA